MEIEYSISCRTDGGSYLEETGFASASDARKAARDLSTRSKYDVYVWAHYEGLQRAAWLYEPR